MIDLEDLDEDEMMMMAIVMSLEGQEEEGGEAKKRSLQNKQCVSYSCPLTSHLLLWVRRMNHLKNDG